MSTIFDLGESVLKHPIRGKEIDVYGISIDGLYFLVDRFPELKLVMQQKLSALNPEKIVELIPNAITTIIGVATISPDAFGSVHSNEYKNAVAKAAKVAAGFSIGEQLKVIAAILKVTLPDGPQSFKQLLAEVTGTFNSAQSSTPVTNSEEPSLATLLTEEPGTNVVGLRRVG